MSYAPKVTIDMSRYVKLLKDESLLDCLYNNDLESWERYSESIEDYGKSFPSNRESDD